MIIKDKNGTVKEREATLKQKGKYKKLYRYTKPEKQAGIATLSLARQCHLVVYARLWQGDSDLLIK